MIFNYDDKFIKINFHWPCVFDVQENVFNKKKTIRKQKFERLL